MNEELINQIVRRILSEPAFQRLMPGTNESTMAVKPDGLVILNFVPDLEQTLKAVKLRWGAEYTLHILPSTSVSATKPGIPEGMNWITPQDALSKGDWQKIMIPACSPNTLAKAALGIRDNPLCEIIGRGITRGIPLVLVTERLGFTLQTPPTYRELYEGYLKDLQSYGVLIYPTLEDERGMIKDQDTDRAPSVGKRRMAGEETGVSMDGPAQEGIRYEKKYLADKDAYGFPEESIVIVKRLTVISPLARDTLKMRRIDLRQEMEGRL